MNNIIKFYFINHINIDDNNTNKYNNNHNMISKFEW